MDRTLSLAVKFSGLDKLSGPLKKMALTSRGAARDVAKTTQELAELGRAQDRLGRHKALQTGLSANNAKLDESRRRIRALREEMAQTDAPTKRLKNSLASAQREEVRLMASGDKQAAKLHTLQAEMKAAGVDMSRLADHERKLARDTHDANTRLTQQQKKLDQIQARRDRVDRFRGYGQKTQELGVSAAAGGAVLGAPLVAATGKAIGFESALADVRKVVNGLDDATEFKAMGTDILNLSKNLPMTAEGIAAIVAAGGQAGLTTGKTIAENRRQLLAFAEDAAKMGVAFDMTADDAGQTMAQWRTAFGIGQREVVALADKVNYLGNNSAANSSKITDIVTRIGPLGAVAGLASGEIAALGATIGGAGVESEIAATGIKNTMLALTKGSAATKSQSQAFKRLGLDATGVAKSMQRDAAGTILDVMERLRRLPKETQASTMTELFGSESVAAISPMLNSLDLLKKNLRMVGDAQQYAGSMQTEYNGRSATTEASLQRFSNRVDVLKVRVGENLLPTLERAAGWLGNMADGVTAWGDAHPAAFKALSLVTAGLAALLAVIGPVAIALSWMMPGLGMLVNGITRLVPVIRFAFVALRILCSGLLWLGRLAMMNPMLAIAMGLILAAYLIYTHWDKVKAFFVGIWQEIRTAFAGGIGGVAALIVNWSPLGLFYRAFAAVMSWFGVSLPAKFTEFGSNIISGLINGLLSKAGQLKSKVLGVARSVANWFKTALGIHSPSRVFMGLGGFLTQGLAIGVDRGAAQPLARIRSVAGQMAAAGSSTATPGRLARAASTVAGAIALGGTAPALAASPASTGAAAAGAGTTVHYNTYQIRIDGAAGDVRAMARQLKAELERLEAQDRAASYQDD
ncbi:phage tail tape measure protein [Sphingomonas sp. ac-8]|uniref:phage tail tape measure protein n=1 Tax=Sphingomonas sp. ac-8 TaxID=3242977 RepID=UPI003A806B79